MVKLGNIVIPPASSTNNKTTVTPFSVTGFPGIEVLTTAADVFVELVDDDGSTSTTSTSTGFPLAANQAIGLASSNGVQPILCKSPLLVCYSTGGATVQVWGLWG